MRLIQAILDLPALPKVIVGLILVGISTGLWFSEHVLWPWGWVVGGLVLALSIPGKKNEWGDW